MLSLMNEQQNGPLHVLGVQPFLPSEVEDKRQHQLLSLVCHLGIQAMSPFWSGVSIGKRTSAD